MEHWNVWRVFSFSKNSFQEIKSRKNFYRLCDFASKRSNVPLSSFQLKILDRKYYFAVNKIDSKK